MKTTSNSEAAELDHLDELDREYYRLKLEQLSWCLPVVRAAKAMLVDNIPLQLRMDRLADAVRALEAAEREGRWTIPS